MEGAELTLFSADLRDADAIEAALTGCEGVFLCAGIEAQAPETVEVMYGGARTVLDVVEKLGIDRVVVQSSTGSMNPPDGEPDVKSEAHWSDPVQQLSVGKYSPAAKTLMDALVLRRMEEVDGLRVVVFNTSMIAGPELSPELGPSARFLAGILKGERMAERIPDGSMSILDVRDLAKLHVAAFEQGDARGRYLGLVKSWPWRDILQGLARAHAGYTPPPWPEGQEPSAPTRYDLTKLQSLGVELRGLDAILEGVVADLEARGAL